MKTKILQKTFLIIATSQFVAFGAPLPTANTQTLAGAWNTTIVFDDPSLPGCTTPGWTPVTEELSRRAVTLAKAPDTGNGGGLDTVSLR
jgi:hypothetical protein